MNIFYLISNIIKCEAAIEGNKISSMIFSENNNAHYANVNFKSGITPSEYLLYSMKSPKDQKTVVPIDQGAMPGKGANGYKVPINVKNVNGMYAFCFHGTGIGEKGVFSETFQYNSADHTFCLSRSMPEPFYKSLWFIIASIALGVLLALGASMIIVKKCRTPKQEL